MIFEKALLRIGPVAAIVLAGGYYVSANNLSVGNLIPFSAAPQIEIETPDSWAMSGEEITDQFRAAHVKAGGTVTEFTPPVAPAPVRQVAITYTPAPAEPAAAASEPAPQGPATSEGPAAPVVLAQPEPPTPAQAAAPPLPRPAPQRTANPQRKTEPTRTAVVREPVARDVPARDSVNREGTREGNRSPARVPASRPQVAAVQQPKIIEPPSLRQLPPPPPEIVEPPVVRVQPERPRGILGRSWDTVTRTTGAVTDAAIAAPGTVWRATRKTVDVVVDTTVDTARIVIPGSRRSSND